MKTFETAAFTMVIYNNQFIEFKIKKDVKLQAKDIWESRDLSVAYMPGKKFYVLLEGEENAGASIDATRAGASEEYAQHVAALALYSNKTHQIIIGNLFLKINKPKVATRFFDDRDKAIAWLQSFAKD